MECIPCDKCGGETKVKEIKRKSDGKKFRVLECLGDCQNDKGYAYTFFPPRDEEGSPEPAPRKVSPRPAAQAPAPAQVQGAAVFLKSIDISLKNILKILQEKTGKLPIDERELAPDDEIPF